MQTSTGDTSRNLETNVPAFLLKSLSISISRERSSATKQFTPAGRLNASTAADYSSYMVRPFLAIFTVDICKKQLHLIVPLR
jgi:hypothetical protein